MDDMSNDLTGKTEKGLKIRKKIFKLAQRFVYLAGKHPDC
jgi:hypothetical protein